MDEGKGSPLRTVYTTLASEEDARGLAAALLADRLIACANLFPLRSLYTWKGEVQDETEVGVFFKTTEDRLDDLLRVLPDRHPYEVPCVEVWPIDRVHPAFGDWVRESVVEGSPSDR